MDPENSNPKEATSKNDRVEVFNDEEDAINKQSASVVLIKKVPPNTTEEQVKQKLKTFGNITRIKLLEHKFYAYVEFEDPKDAKKCVGFYTEDNVLTLNDGNVLVYLTSTGKNENKPLDLNPPSNILLLTFFKNKVEINVRLVLEMMNEYDEVEKIIVYEKQNIHALVEFKNIKTSVRVKEELDNTKWKGLFLVRVQYTKKRSLSINPNSPLEYKKGDDINRYPPNMANSRSPYPHNSDNNMSQTSGSTHSNLMKYLGNNPSKRGMNPSSSNHQFFNKPMNQRNPYNNPNFSNVQSDFQQDFSQFASPQLHAVGGQSFGYPPRRPHQQRGAPYAATPNLHPRNFNNRKNDMLQFRVLRVSNLAHFVNATTIFNLFSQYGYIMAIKIAYFGEQTEAFVNFYENSECQLARDFLNKVPLFEKPMRVGLTKFISVEENEFFERSDKKISSDFTDMRQLQRFKRPGVRKNIRLARPNKAVEITNLPPIQEESFLHMVSTEFNILSTSSDQSSFFVELASLEQATHLIVKYNNFEISGLKINAYFSSWSFKKRGPQGMEEMVRQSPYMGSRGSPFNQQRDLPNQNSPYLTNKSPYYMGRGQRRDNKVYSDSRFSPYVDPLRSPNYPNMRQQQPKKQHFSRYVNPKIAQNIQKERLRNIEESYLPDHKREKLNLNPKLVEEEANLEDSFEKMNQKSEEEKAEKIE